MGADKKQCWRKKLSVLGELKEVLQDWSWKTELLGVTVFYLPPLLANWPVLTQPLLANWPVPTQPHLFQSSLLRAAVSSQHTAYLLFFFFFFPSRATQAW